MYKVGLYFGWIIRFISQLIFDSIIIVKTKSEYLIINVYVYSISESFHGTFWEHSWYHMKTGKLLTNIICKIKRTILNSVD